ncbi:unnamed protein product [Dovyalis caffra]|uniref:Uncharacterized protein n=1 Tax=Dovyalis caffra TaxID=77055 RepID=A0AAV1RDY0_9ROSI|nr:unnamed protein product [Dovyalis caffra]
MRLKEKSQVYVDTLTKEGKDQIQEPGWCRTQKMEKTCLPLFAPGICNSADSDRLE